ncbi:hypothetical protein MZM54_32800 [[Brevibacterium] frigoritolerans]|nr:hypothetical protein [Peribacillus frigoritolerans]
MNEIEELKRLLQTGFNDTDKQFDGIRKEFVKVHEEFDKVNSRFDNVNARLDAIKEKGKFDGEVLERLKWINANLEGNIKG